jgi:hypothetical protein
MYKKILLLILCVLMLTGFTSPVMAKTCCEKAEEASAAAIFADAVFIRPFWLACTVLGTGVFVLTSPFTLIGKNIGHSAEVLVAEPAINTFGYPLGSY